MRTGASTQPFGFALISVLAMVTLACLMTTGFLAANRLERMSSRSVGEQARLNLALDMGCDLAQGILVDRTTALHTWINYVYQADSNGIGYPIIGSFLFNTAPGSRGWQYGYLFSPTGVAFRDNVRRFSTNAEFGFRVTPNSQSAFARAAGSNLASMISGLAANSNGATRIPLLGGRTSPPVAWITNFTTVLTTNTNLWLPTHRMAYYVEDLSGLYDVERMGGATNRSTGTNPQEIQLAAMGITNVATFTNARRAFLTWGLLDAFLRSNFNTNATFFATGLRSLNGTMTASNQTKTNRGYDRIPPGLGYETAETSRTNQPPKRNLNGTFTNTSGPYGNANATNVSTIVAALQSNLPSFTDRAGGFTNSAGGGATNTNAYTGTAYLQTLAANIIDYADADSTPSTDGTGISTNRVRPVYRGVDSCPYVNEINKRYLLSSTSPMTISGINGLAYRVETTDYLELWNPSSQSTQPGTLTFLAVHGQPATLGFSNISFDRPLWASNSLGPISNGITSNSLTVPVIPPNGFTTLACPTTTNLFFYGATNNPPVFTLTQEFTNSRYFVAWNGVYYDAAMGGIRRNSGNLTLNSPANRGNLPSFIYATSGGNFADPAVGDPRATIYLSQVLDFNAYVGNATFGGRNVRAGSVASTKEYYEVTPAGWPDGGHNSPKGSSPTSDNQLPTSFASMNTNLSPGRISNFGSFTNICELGGVFDPIQWADPSLGVWQGKWTNLSVSGISSNSFGGGTSLRVGRAEHPKFAWTNPLGGTNPAQPNMALSAAALLDLFSVNFDSRIDEGGKININTAPPAVLRALAAGVVLTNDPNMSPANLAVPAAAVDAFVRGVTNFRAKYPFYSPSQLSFIGTDAAWPNTNTWPAGAVFGTRDFGTGTTNVNEWNDAAAEEWFSRIYGLSKTYGRHFRVYVVAQMLSTNTNSSGYVPRGTVARKYYQIYLRPNDNAQPDVGPLITLRAAY